MSALSADMIYGRPSVQLPSVSGVDNKYGLTMVRPRWQSAHSRRHLIRINMYARYTAIFEVFDIR